MMGWEKIRATKEKKILLPFSHLTSPSVTDSANAGVFTVTTSSPVKDACSKMLHILAFQSSGAMDKYNLEKMLIIKKKCHNLNNSILSVLIRCVDHLLAFHNQHGY